MDPSQRRDPSLAGLVHHNDAGSQYTSIAFTDRLCQAGVDPSVGSIGDAYDCEDCGAVARDGLTRLTTGPAGALALTCRPSQRQRCDRWPDGQ